MTDERTNPEDEIQLTVLESLCDITAQPYPPQLGQDELRDLVQNVARLANSTWRKLPEGAQIWYNDTVTLFRTNRPLIPPDDYDPHYKPNWTRRARDRLASKRAALAKAAKTDAGTAKATDGTKPAAARGGKGAGKTAKPRSRAGRNNKPPTIVSKVPPRSPDDPPVVIRRRARSGGTGQVVVRFAIEGGVNDWDRLSAEIKANNVKVGDSTVQAALYHLRHVARALSDLGADLGLLAPFLQESGPESDSAAM